MNAPERPTVLGIRLRHPRPTGRDDGYSVGGALCLSMGGDQAHECDRRPSCGRLAYRLGDANPSLNWEAAIYYAEQIDNAEAQGDIESAWARLDEALQYYPGKSIISSSAPCPECGLLEGHRTNCATRCPECGGLQDECECEFEDDECEFEDDEYEFEMTSASSRTRSGQG
jgi:predicted Zn-ribbon and HTH transcriptional regulator